MRPIRNFTGAFSCACAALLAAASLIVLSPAAHAEYILSYHRKETGNERIRAIDQAQGECGIGPSAAHVAVVQEMRTYADEVGHKRAFLFGAAASHRDGLGSTWVTLQVGDEEVLPPSHGNEFALQGSYPGSKTGLPFDSFYHFAGRTRVAVGNQAYMVFATWYIRMDFDLAGHAYSVTETAIRGSLNTTQSHIFYAHLPENILLEDASQSPSLSGSDLWLNLHDPSPPRFSKLSCDLHTRDSALIGNLCRFQQDPLVLKARLIHTATIGGLAYTEFIPVVEDEAPAVDKLLIDTRVQTPVRRLRRRR